MHVADAVIDMYLLKECNAIVRYPPNSFFSFWADVSQTERGVLTDGTIRSDQNAYDLLLPAIAWTP